MFKRFSTCSKDCYGSCVFESYWNGSIGEERLILAKPLKDHPFTQGIFCPKYSDRQTLLYHPNRLKSPYFRKIKCSDRDIKNISIKKTIELVVEKLYSNLTTYGPRSIIGAYYTGNQCLISYKSPFRLFNSLGSRINSGGICNEGGCAGLSSLFGTYSLTNPFQIVNPETKLIVIWGSNLSENNNHAYLMVRRSKFKNNTKIIVIDSRKTKIAQQADMFIQVDTNKEGDLALYLCKKLLDTDHHDKKFIKNHVSGFESFKSQLLLYFKDINISHSDIGAEINYLMEFLIKFQYHTLFLVGYGVQKDLYGGITVQSISILQTLLGNYGKSGCGLIYSQSDYYHEFKSNLESEITLLSNPDQIQTFELMKLTEILEDPEVKILFIWNFNPASSFPNQSRLRKALMREDLFIICLDLFETETTKFSNVVIPGKFEVETNDIVTSYYIPGISINQAGFCPYPECISNHDFFRLLGQEIGKKLNWSAHTISQFYQTDKEIVEKYLGKAGKKVKTEIELNGYTLFLDENTVLFKDLNFPTISNKILLDNFKIFPKVDTIWFLKDQQDNSAEFTLLTPNYPYLLHSQLSEINLKYIDDFKNIYLNPEDIKESNLVKYEEVEVLNKFGKGKFIIGEMESLNRKTALIYSGAPNKSTKLPNANFFTPDIPEILGHSGSFNSAKIKIKSLRRKI